MTISGALDPTGRDLVLVRDIPASAAALWEHLTRSSLLSTWFGTFTGDPASGTVQVTMTAEPGEATATGYTLHACEPARLLTVSSSMGEDTWRLSVALDEAEPGITQVALRHHEVPAAMLGAVGPGWEWYLDRLTGAVTGGDISGMDVWESRYMTLSEEYAALAG